MSAVLPSSAAGGATPIDPSTPLSRASDDDKGDPVVGAVERLALSRERLRAAMMPKVRESSGLSDGIGSFATGLVDKLRASPGLSVMVDAVEEWWAKHPLHTAGVMAAEATRRLAAPVAERRPLTLVFGAVFVGALLALLRPWRLLLRPAVFAGLLPAIVLRVMREVPLETWLHAAAGARGAPAPDAPVVWPAGTPFAAPAEATAATRPVPPVTSPAAVEREPSTVYP